MPDGFRLQDQVRRLYFGEWLGQYTSDRFRTLNRRLVEVFRGAPGEARDAVVPRRQVVFHAIGVDQESGFADFEQLFRVQRQQYRLSDCAAMLTLVHEYDPVLAPGRAIRLSYQEGKLAADLHRWDEAEAQFTKVVESAAASEDLDLRVRALLRLGTVHRDQRRWEPAIASYERALALARRTPGRTDDTRSMHWLAVAHRDSGNFDKAERLLRESIDLAEGADDTICAAQGHNALGLLHLRHHSGLRSGVVSEVLVGALASQPDQAVAA
jgi:tetratricopeptide (TPR) repeat protein